MVLKRKISVLLALLLAVSLCAHAELPATEEAQGQEIIGTIDGTETVGAEDSDDGGETYSEPAEPEVQEYEDILGGEDDEPPVDGEPQTDGDTPEGETQESVDPVPEGETVEGAEPTPENENTEEPQAGETPEEEGQESPESGDQSRDSADGADEADTDDEAAPSEEESGEEVVSEAVEAAGQLAEQTVVELETEAEKPVAGETAPVMVVPSTEAAAAEGQSTIVKLGVGERTSLPEAAVPGTTYATSNGKIVSVTANGVVRGRKRGSATVTATRPDGVVTYSVHVFKAPKKINFSKKKYQVAFDAATNQGDWIRLTPTFPAGSYSKVTYSGYNPRIINISADGVVTAVGTGTTRVTAKTFNKKKARIRIQVVSPPGSLSLNAPTLNICAGATFTIKPVVPKNTATSLKFSYDNPNIISVDGDGQVTALAEGTANIEAVSINGLKANCTVNVLPAPVATDLAVTTLRLGVKEKSASILKNAAICAVYGSTGFSSTKKRVASVNGEGVVTAKKRGSADIKVTFRDGSQATVRVKVLRAPSRVSFGRKKLTLEAYSSYQLKAKLPKNTGGTVYYSSSKPAVAQVDANGVVTGMGVGKAVITARTYNGKKAKCTVTVTKSKPQIRMSETLSVGVGSAVELPIEVVSSNGSAYTGPVDVSIDPSGVAIYEDGRVIGLMAGKTAVLTVAAGSSSKTCAITVTGKSGSNKVMAIAHRGSKHWTENSPEAFRNFPSLGADGVELDIRSLSDGVQVVAHDDEYTGSDGNRYMISAQSSDYFRQYAPGTMCTLDQAMPIIADTGKQIFLNPKDTARGMECVKLVKKYGVQSRTIYFCNVDSILKDVYAADSSAVLGYTLSNKDNITDESWVKKAQELHLTWIFLHKGNTTAEAVYFWHSKGYKVCVWTVDDQSSIQSFCNMGVDAILSNYPEYVVSAQS